MNISRLFTVIALSLLMAACSSRSADLLESVPSDATLVATFDTPALLSESGITIKDGNVTFAGSLGDRLPAGFRNTLSDLATATKDGALDLSRTALVCDRNGTEYITCAIDSRDKLKESFGDRIKWSGETDGLAKGTIDGSTSVAVSDTRLWMARLDADRLAEGVAAMISAAGKNPMSKVTGISQALAADGLVNIVALRDRSNPPAGHAEANAAEYITASLDVADHKTLTADVKFIKGDGASVPIKGLKPVNPAVLAYVPASAVLTLAAGITPEFDWSIIGDLFILSGDFQTQAMFTTALPYLTAIDGTVMISAEPLGDEAWEAPDPSNTRITVMAHMPQAKIDELLDMIKGMCFGYGIKPSTDPKTGMMHIDMLGLHLWLGSADGYFAASTRPLSADNNNSLAPVFDGKNGALSLRIPSLRLLNPSFPEFGADLQVQAEPDVTRGRLTLPGSDAPVLESILNAFYAGR